MGHQYDATLHWRQNEGYKPLSYTIPRTAYSLNNLNTKSLAGLDSSNSEIYGRIGKYDKYHHWKKYFAESHELRVYIWYITIIPKSLKLFTTSSFDSQTLLHMFFQFESCVLSRVAYTNKCSSQCSSGNMEWNILERNTGSLGDDVISRLILCSRGTNWAFSLENLNWRYNISLCI